jgi:hypothetical protein
MTLHHDLCASLAGHMQMEALSPALVPHYSLGCGSV